MKILVSACLLGLNCKYTGENNLCPQVIKLGEQHTLIPVCPEQLGGLPTPRPPAERQGGRVITAAGADVTAPYEKGARETARLAELLGAELAVLKARSPACGAGAIYDGSFTHRLIEADGVAAQALKEMGIPVYTEACIPPFL